MKKCVNCGKSLSNDYEFCPKCGVKQSIELVEIGSDDLNEEKSSGTGIGCLVWILFLLILMIVGGIGLYLYNNGFYKLFEENDNNTDSIVAIIDTIVVEKGLPTSLILDGSMSSGEVITIDVNISSTGKVEGVYYNRNKKGRFDISGKGDKKTGVIKIEVPGVALNIEMIPMEDNDGSYDGYWEDKTSRGTIYFYEASGRHLQPFEDTIPQFVPEKELMVQNKDFAIRLVGRLYENKNVDIQLSDIERGVGSCSIEENGETTKMKLKCKKDLDGEWTMMLQNSSGTVSGCFIGKFVEGDFVGKYYDNNGEEQKVKLKQR